MILASNDVDFERFRSTLSSLCLFHVGISTGIDETGEGDQRGNPPM